MKIRFPSSVVKTFLLLFLIFNSAFLILNSISAQIPNTWTQRANFPGATRVSAAGFTIGSKGYVGTGLSATGDLLADFWEYDPSINTWTRLTPFAGSPRRGAVGFSVSGKGYIGTGFDGTNNLKDFWEYDTLSGSWSRKRDLGGTTNANPRRDAVSFVINDKGYIATGYDGTTYYNKECWQYDGDTTWIKKADVGSGLQGSYRRWATGFSIDTNGYVGCGYNYSQDWKKDFWKYNMSANSWTQKADYGGTGRGNSAAFTINGKAYMGTGNDDYFKSDFWRYEAASNTWIQIADFGGGAISEGIAFSIQGSGYAGLGRDSLGFRNDFWIYTPDSTIGINEPTSETFNVSVFPNPFTEQAILKIDNPSFPSNNFSCTLYDVKGNKLREESMKKNFLVIERKNLPSGIYFYSVQKNSNHKIYSTGKILVE